MATALYRFPAINQEAETATTAAQPATATSENALEQFSLTPLSAGDIIDRAVRLYRQQLLAFIRIVIPPTLLAYAGGVLWTIGLRNMSFEHGDLRMVSMIGAVVVGFIMWMTGKALFLMAMGASSRSLVFLFFNGTPMTARDVYRAVRERVWGLLGATIMLGIFGASLIIAGYTIAAMLGLVYVVAVMALTKFLPEWLMLIMHFTFGTLLALLLLAGFLMAYARIVYTPQAMMVEGKSVFDAFGRSFTLAKGEFLRIGAVLLFQFCVAWSLYALLLVPLGWYGYFHESEGISLTSLFDTTGPLWFTIAQQTLTQVGEILIAPIILLSFTLLYLNSRVCKEGFDVELLANRVLPPAKYETKAAVPVAPPEPSILPQPAIDWSEELEQEELANAPDLPTQTPLITEPFVSKLAPIPATYSVKEPVPETVEIAPIPVAVTSTNPAALLCPHCGTNVNDRARFCPACGGKL